MTNSVLSRNDACFFLEIIYVRQPQHTSGYPPDLFFYRKLPKTGVGSLIDF